MRSTAVSNIAPSLLDKMRLPKSGAKILAAVSGGIDSMVLLHALRALSRARRWRLTVAHFNHCLRDKESDKDELLVRKTASAMKLPCVTARANVREFAKESKLSIEMAARKLRHEFLAKTARQRNIKIVALAHHADDQVELFFLRLLRGTGGGGLAGMKWRSPSPVDREISLVRPLLHLGKAEIEELAKKNRIRYREDASNYSVDFLRNRIRHELLPLLRRHYQPALNKTILRLMEIVGAESELAGEMAALWNEGKEMALKAGDFSQLPEAVQREVLRSQLKQLGIAADFDLVEELRDSESGAVTVGANLSIFRDRKGRVQARESQAQTFDGHTLKIDAAAKGQVNFDGVQLRWQLRRNRGTKTFTASTAKTGAESFDAEKCGREIVLRHWQPGDRFQPIGLKSPKKLQDLFTNQKIPRERRPKLALAETRGEIFWVEGLRIAEDFKLTPRTKQVLRWNWRRTEV